jgi:hypothetical protein
MTKHTAHLRLTNSVSPNYLRSSFAPLREIKFSRQGAKSQRKM